MKTAIQELLDEIKECRNIETDLLLPFIRNKIQSKLPKEREQIEQAFTSGEFNNYEDDDGMCISPEEYYLKTFKQ